VASLVTYLMDELDITPLVDAGTEVELVARGNGKRRYLALLNHSAGGHRVQGLTGGRVTVGDGEVTKAGELRLPPYGVAVVTF
jgi:hypothetical protein